MSDMKPIMENWKRFSIHEGGNFDRETGAPITDQGKELCAKNPECREKHLDTWADEEGTVQFRQMRGPNKLSMDDRFALSRRIMKMWSEFGKELTALGDHEDQDVGDLITHLRDADAFSEFTMKLMKVMDMLAGQGPGARRKD